MGAKQLLSHILHDDGLTRGLDDAEARMLVEWLVAEVEHIGEGDSESLGARAQVGRLCRKGRAIGRFVRLWCHAGARPAALQLAASERFHWPYPATEIDPCELMQSILDWENTFSGRS